MGHSVLSRSMRGWLASLACTAALLMLVGPTGAFAGPARKGKSKAAAVSRAKKKVKRGSATVTLTGTLTVTTGEQGKLSSIQLVTESDGTYKVFKDKPGRKLAEAMGAKQVELEAVVSLRGSKKSKVKERWLRVKAFKEVEGAATPPEKPEAPPTAIEPVEKPDTPPKEPVEKPEALPTAIEPVEKPEAPTPADSDGKGDGQQ